MSVQMIENWSEIEGQVTGLWPDRELEAFTVVELSVRRVVAVEEYANLLAHLEEDSRLEVLFPNEIVVELELAVGVQLVARVRRAGLERVFVHREEISLRED